MVLNNSAAVTFRKKYLTVTGQRYYSWVLSTHLPNGVLMLDGVVGDITLGIFKMLHGLAWLSSLAVTPSLVTTISVYSMMMVSLVQLFRKFSL